MYNQSLRNKIKSQRWIWVIVFLGLATSIVSKKVPHYKEVTVAKVNGKKISRGDFQEALNEARLENELWAMYLGVNPAALERERNPEKMAYQRCVTNALLDDIADDFGFDFAQEYVAEQLVSRLPQEAFDSSGAVNMEAYKAFAKRLNTTVPEFERRQEDNLIREFTNYVIGESIYTPSYVTEQEHKELAARKKFGVLHFKFDAALNNVSAKELEAADIEKYYARHKEEYRKPEARSATYWKIDVKGYKDKVTIEESSLERYFNSHRQEYARPAQATVRRLLIAVKGNLSDAAAQDKAFKLKKELDKAPKDFARLARQHSDDKKSAENGGLMPAFARGTHDSLFDRTAFNLKKGDISEVIRTAAGYEILQLENKVAASEAAFESVRKDIHQKVLDKKATALLSQELEGVMRAVRDGEQTIEKFAESKGLKKYQSGFLTREEANGEKLDALLAQAIFGLMKRRSNAGYFPQEGEYVLYERAATKEAHIPALETIKNDVKKDLHKERALERIKTLVAQAEREFFAGKALSVLADSVASYSETAEGSLEGLSKSFSSSPAVIKKAFKQNHIGQLAQQREKNDYFLASMLNADYTSENADKKIQVETNYTKSAHAQAFIASLCASAKIVAGQEIAAEQAEESVPDNSLDY